MVGLWRAAFEWRWPPALGGSMSRLRSWQLVNAPATKYISWVNHAGGWAGSFVAVGGRAEGDIECRVRREEIQLRRVVLARLRRLEALHRLACNRRHGVKHVATE